MILIDAEGLMVTDSAIPELHAFATFLGLNRGVFQNERLPHYDVLTETLKAKAVRGGAEIVDSMEIDRRAVRPEIQ